MVQSTARSHSIHAGLRIPGLSNGSLFVRNFSCGLTVVLQMLVGVVSFNTLRVMDPADNRAVGVLLAGYFFQGA